MSLPGLQEFSAMLVEYFSSPDTAEANKNNAFTWDNINDILEDMGLPRIAPVTVYWIECPFNFNPARIENWEDDIQDITLHSAREASIFALALRSGVNPDVFEIDVFTDTDREHLIETVLREYANPED